MAKLLLLAVVLIAFSLQQSEAAIKCYYCMEACEVSKADFKTCGQNIGPSQEAVCTTEWAKDTKARNMAIRKCQIVSKGTEPACPTNSECKSCKEELCNSAPSLATSMTLFSVVSAVLVTKFL
ncbi:hypothetical protein TcasGA2_TC006596 [Tribolium castaneum]|uniref:Protein sleepless n=1 Tax=Tribolium castaneum TaxID=7070 RepID=D6WXR5_TRICA|nr:PREDICTED: uncharacterized protein LOC100142097 [Tribolium castaneum]EFA08895.1 hypothetical protein TcasGA2_TC006596 [Tribolium castaneum]|eukprot:XP_001814166.1 PREDICTED: uncharacterized protein LOC100142097 [Tribolium castaneum]